jgi:hypothetical protein
MAPCEAFDAAAVFHGHAHHGVAEARSPKGIPVYNVALPVLRREGDRKFRVFDLEAPPGGTGVQPAALQ